MALLGRPRGGRRHAYLTPAEEDALLAPFLAEAEAGGVLVAAPIQAAYEARVGKAVPPVDHLPAAGPPRLAQGRPPPPPPRAAGRRPGGVQKGLAGLVVEEVARQAAAGDGGRPVRLMFEDEARFGRCQDPRRCWAPPGVRPRVASQFVREFSYAYAALSPHDGALVSLVLPVARTDAMTLFLAELARRHPDERVLLVLDGAGWHWAKALVVPANVRLIAQPAHSPELNPVEHLWEEVREKWFANRAVRQPGRGGGPAGRGAGDPGAGPGARRQPGRLRLDHRHPLERELVSMAW